MTKITWKTLTNEQIRAHCPTAYGAITGKLDCTLEEQLDCYHADGSRPCDPAERQRARKRIATSINAKRKITR